MKKIVLKKTVVANLSKDSMNVLRGGIEYVKETALCPTRKITCGETAHCFGETRNADCVTPGATFDNCFPDTMTCNPGVVTV